MSQKKRLTHKELGDVLGGGRDFWPTPQVVADYVVAYLLPPLDTDTPHLLDAGAGTGVWGKAAYKRFGNHMHLVGVDLPGIVAPPHYNCFYHEGFDVFAKGYKGQLFDAVIGNPPFGNDIPQKWLYWLWNKLVRRDGYILWLLRMAWAESERRYDAIFNAGMAPYMTFNSAKRLSFTGDGKTDETAYKVFLWRVGWNGYTNEGWSREEWFHFGRVPEKTDGAQPALL